MSLTVPLLFANRCTVAITRTCHRITGRTAEGRTITTEWAATAADPTLPPAAVHQGLVRHPFTSKCSTIEPVASVVEEGTFRRPV